MSDFDLRNARGPKPGHCYHDKPKEECVWCAWPYPWPKRDGAYASEGPTIATVVHLPGADYLVEPTGDSGLHSGRDKHRVSCVTCDVVIHRNTTGCTSRIQDHHHEKHQGRMK